MTIWEKIAQSTNEHAMRDPVHLDWGVIGIAALIVLLLAWFVGFIFFSDHKPKN